MEKRIAQINRTTKETKIELLLNLDEYFEPEINTGIGFFDHLLEQFAFHSRIGLKIKTIGDLHIDEHHTIEDTAITLGQAFFIALGDKKKINRYGFFIIPMDESLAQVAIDFSGRSYFISNLVFKRLNIGQFPTEMFTHVFKSFSDNALCTLNIKSEGENDHHKIEAVFKAFGRAVKIAVKVDAENTEIQSTKGLL